MRIPLIDLSITIINGGQRFIREQNKNYNILKDGNISILSSCSILQNLLSHLNGMDNNLYFAFTSNEYTIDEMFEYYYFLMNYDLYTSFDDSNTNYSKRYNPSIEITEEDLFYLKLKYPKLVKVKT